MIPAGARIPAGGTRHQVVVTSPFVGGGFGSKTLWQHQILAAAAARSSCDATSLGSWGRLRRTFRTR